MQLATQKAPAAEKLLWGGRIISALTILFLLFDGIIHLMKIAPVLAAFAQLGYPASLAVDLGILELVCVALYLVPRTSILGAILLTGYLGGAIATQLRVGNPLLSQALFPAYVGMMVWVGLYLRDQRLRTILSQRH